MKAISMIGTGALSLSLAALGACTVDTTDRTLGDGAASLEEAPPAPDDGDLGADFGDDDEDPEGNPTDPDDHSGGDPDLDFTDDGIPLDHPGDDVPFDYPDDDPSDDCIPVTEDCDNGADDDCDGLRDGDDPDCPQSCTWQTINCAAVELVGHCNTHLGDNLDACYAAGNAGNCTPEELYAWCTRRIDEGPGGAWYDYIQDWVDDRCDGTVHYEVINGDDYYWCEDDDSCERFECKTPLVLVFDVDQRVKMTADDGTSTFDLSTYGDGSATRTDWPTPTTPWLVLDRDGDGRISSGMELFGSATPMSTGTAQNGFEPLAVLDDNGDGLLDACDPSFAELQLWTDTNGDRISQSQELRSLTDYGVESLELDYRMAPRCDVRGNCERERSRFQWRSVEGSLHEGAVVDVHLAVRQ